MNRRPILVSAAFVAFLLASAVPGAAQEPVAEPSAAAAVWHIVRPGETLEEIAARFLGSPRSWREILLLNRNILNPDRIAPGQRIRVPTVRPGVPAARLTRLSRQVEEQPSPIAWQDAQVGDMLVERDGVRTRRKASAEMRFVDGARLVMTEDSLVFLRRSGSSLRSVERKSVEIVEGQAELEARAASAAVPSPEVEIVLGSTVATSRADSAGPAQTRARRSEEGGAKLMAYGGESAVSAGGAVVQVSRGMGTSVAAQGPPSPPEKLLAAPGLLDPAGGAERACADPELSWEAVPGADFYVIEVCRDAGCGELVERQVGETATRWRPAALPLGEIYWRVTARSASGLDGYPSAASPLAITSDRVGLGAPVGSLQVTGPQVMVGDRLFVAGAARLEVSAADAAGAPSQWRPVLQGKEESGWPASWSAGEHTAAAVAVDGCGNRGPIAPVSFVVDTEPPAIRWQVADRQSLADRLAPDSERERRRLRGKYSGRPARDSWASFAGVWRIPLPWNRQGERAGIAQLPITIASDHPQAFFTGREVALSVDGRGTALGDRILWVAADDAGAGVDRLSFRTRPDGDRVVLEIEAVDQVGNLKRQEIPLLRARSET